MNDDTLGQLTRTLRDFAAAREWDQFHTPKNLAIALAVEASELLEHFQWLTPEQSEMPPPETLAQIELELADVLLYVLRLADRLNVDLIDAARRKIALNEEKYPVEKSRGVATKYTRL